MKLSNNGPRIEALPVPAKASEQPIETPLSGEGKIVWASPGLARVLGGSSLGNVSGTAKIYPVTEPKASARENLQRGVEFFDDAGIPLSDFLKGIVEDGVKSRQIGATGGKLFTSTIAGAEILLELTDPSDKSVLEKTLSISLNALEMAEPLTDWVPHLAHAKPYLVAILDVGGQLMAAVKTRESDTGQVPGIPLAARKR